MEIIPRCEGREIHLLRRGYFLCFDIFLEPAVWLVWNSWFDQVLIKHWYDYIFSEIFGGEYSAVAEPPNLLK